MKIKWSGIGITEGRGKISGSVASKNRSGAYARVKVTPVNPNTIAQQQARLVLAQFSQAWRALAAASIEAWNAAVSEFSTTDIFGDLRQPTGKNLFTRLNANLNSVGIVPIIAPPAVAGVTPAIVTGVSVAVGAATYDIAFTGDTVGMSYQIWATPSLSAGVSFVKSQYRQIGSVAGGGGSPYSFAADYVAKFGAPAVGQKVFAKMVAVNETTGEKSTGSTAATIVLA